MSIFDSIINDSNETLDLGDKTGNLLSSLLSLMTDQNQGGFAGFLDRFRTIGLNDEVDSWIGRGSNITLSAEQVEAALGTGLTAEMARQAGLNPETARGALGRMIPRVVDELTPEGRVSTDNDLLSKIGGYLSGVGGATISTTGVMESDTIDRFGTAAAEHIERHHTAELIAGEFNDDSPVKWIVPLVIFVLLMVVGYAFCGGGGTH